MKRSVIAVPVLSAALLAPTMPAFAAAPTTAPAATVQGIGQVTTVEQAQQALAVVDARIAELQALPAAQVPAAEVPKVNYGNEITKLIKTALELRGVVETIAAGGVPLFDPATIQPRIQLFLATTQTIVRATHELTTKVDAAHVELGFCITRGVLRLVNPSATVAMITDAQAEILATFDKVATYPDLQPGDRATIYVKASLDSRIWAIRLERDKTLLGKDPVAYRAVNRALTHAVGVWFDAGATVQQVTDEMAALDAAWAAAVA